jgi:hypothetical protein
MMSSSTKLMKGYLDNVAPRTLPFEEGNYGEENTTT